MLKAVWSNKGYILLGLLAYVIVLALTVPLNLVWEQVKPHAKGLPVTVKNMNGTLWQGQTTVFSPQVGNVQASWTISPMSLLAANVELDLNLAAQGVSVESQVTVGQEIVSLSNTKATLDSAILRPMLAASRTSLGGEFELNNFTAAYNYKNPEVIEANGRVLFSGGDVAFPIDGKVISSRLPMIIGDINKQDKKLVLSLNTEDQASLGQGYFEPHGGWAGIAIKRRFLDVLGQQWPGKADEDDVIFEVSEKVL